MQSWDGEAIDTGILDQLAECSYTKSFLPTTILIDFNTTGLFLHLADDNPHGANYCLLNLPLTKRKEFCADAWQYF